MSFFSRSLHISKPKLLAFEILHTRFHYGYSNLITTNKTQKNPIHGCGEFHNTKVVILDKRPCKKAIKKF